MRFIKFNARSKMLSAFRRSSLVTLRNITKFSSRKLEFPENGGRNTFFSGEISFRGLQKASLSLFLSLEMPRSSWVPHRHNTSHYVIRASLDTAIYHSSARIPIYRSSPYACKTQPTSSPSLRAFQVPLSSLSMSPVERKEGSRSRAENNRGGDRANDRRSLMNIVSLEWVRVDQKNDPLREIDALNRDRSEEISIPFFLSLFRFFSTVHSIDGEFFVPRAKKYLVRRRIRNISWARWVVR